MTTKTAQFTQGPWVVDEDYEDEEQQAIGIVKEGHGYIAGIHILASSNNGEGFTSEDRANAHLIAAAPAMFEELKEGLVLLEASHHDMVDMYGIDSLQAKTVWERIESTRNVIAQAEGKHD